MIYNKITENIIGAAIEVHKALGPGLLESTYQVCSCYELESLGYSVKKRLHFLLLIKVLF